MLVLSAACWYARARQKPPMPFVLDRAGVRPIDYDPAEDAAARQPRFDPSLYSPEQLVQIEQTLRMIAATQAEAENARCGDREPARSSCLNKTDRTDGGFRTARP
jgi:hypothetical protein